jgi:hypothetical protein
MRPQELLPKLKSQQSQLSRKKELNLPMQHAGWPQKMQMQFMSKLKPQWPKKKQR